MTMTLTAFSMGRVNKKVEKEENDDDDNDQWFDEFDQSLENYNDIGPHTNPKAFFQLISGKRVLTKDQRTVRRSRCPESKKNF